MSKTEIFKPISEDDLISILKEHLSISISVDYGFKPYGEKDRLKVTLSLKGEQICADEISL